MGKFLLFAAYAAFTAFWLRFFWHALVWWQAWQPEKPPARPLRLRAKACALAAWDIFLFGRLFKVNLALWVGEWVFHAAFLLVVLRHLRFFLDPVPSWVWWAQRPGLIAGYMLPLSLVYILFVRLVSKREKYAAPANVFLLALVLVISSIGVVMHALFTPNLVDVKLFILGIVNFAPAVAPESLLFMLHFCLLLVLVLVLPTHIFAAPLVMMEAREREQELHGVMHDE